MKTKEEIISELDRLRVAEKNIKVEINELQSELVECIAEFKIGQRVIHKEEEYEIVSRGPGWSDKRVKYMGCKVLKSGVLHKRRLELYSEIKAK